MTVTETKIISPKILIVEDVEGMLNILGERFRQDGFNVVLAQDGQEGLAKALLHSPDIILTDVLMPVMDGLKMVRYLRQDPKTKNIPVVLLSILGEFEYNHRLEGVEGIVDVLWKNEVSLDEIVFRVKKHLK